MLNKLTILVFLLIVFLVPGYAVTKTWAAEADTDSLDSKIAEFMETNHIPGIAAAAFKSGKVVWTGTYGFGSIESETPVTKNTLFQIASISKPVTATILMSLYAEGAFGLDDDVNAYLPFDVRNPNFPEMPITFRQLLRHRSSIADDYDYYAPYWQEANGDPTTILGEYLKSYLAVGGSAYSAEKNFTEAGPDASPYYCNTCYALLGYLAETISGEPFEKLSEEVLFTPLNMTDTGWFLRDLEGKDIAMPYRYATEEGFVPYGHVGYPDWPAGQLRSSINDFARFMAAYTNNGITEDGRNVIDVDIVDTLSPRSPHQGFHTWFQHGLSNGEVVYAHNGADLGVNTIILMDRVANKGVVVFANGEFPIAPIAQDVYLAIDALIAERTPGAEE